MRHKICYSATFPKMSELIIALNPKINLKLITVFGILVLLVIILLYNPLIEQFLFFLVGLIFITICGVIAFIKKSLIKRIEQVFQENLALLKKAKLHDQPLQCNFNFSAQKNISRYFRYSFIFVFILMGILFRIFNIENIYRLYFIWAILFIVPALLTLINLQSIIELLRRLMEAFYQKVIDNKDFSKPFLEVDSKMIDWKRYKIKWITQLMFLSLMALPYFYFMGLQSAGALLCIALIILALIMLDVYKIADKCLTVLGSYDDYVKSKLGMQLTLSNKKQTESFFPFCDLEEMEQKNERIKNIMNKNVKEIFK